MVSRTRRYRGSLLLALLGCRGPGDALGAPPDSLDGSTTAAGTSSSMTVGATDGGSLPDSDSDSGDTEPSRVPAFEWPPLPDGCGDGVVTPGQYDCFRAIELPSAEAGFIGAMDLDRDGRDEFLIHGPRASPDLCEGAEWCGPILSLRLAEDDELEVTSGPLTVPMGDNAPYFTDRDLTADGRPDLVIVVSDGWFQLHAGLADGTLGPLEWRNVWGDGRSAVPTALFPIDPDVDGRPEFLVNEFGMGGAARLRREVDGEWTGVGPPLDLPGCQLLRYATYGDFDEDGVEDIAVMESGSGCDPYPEEYDPSHYRLSVFTSDTSTGFLVQQPTFATGGIPLGVGFWTFDVDDDGHIDVVFNSGGLAVALGHGDGTFDDGQIRDELNEALDAVGATLFKAIGDFDGDGSRELTGTISLQDDKKEQWIVGTGLGAETLALHYPFSLVSGGRFQTGDFNGDGITDFVTRHPDDELKRYWLMVSTP